MVLRSVVMSILVSCFFLSLNAQQNPRNTDSRIKNSLSGQVTDATGNALAGATIYIHDQKRGVSCDNNGYYKLINLGSGSRLIEVSHIGFSTVTEYIVVEGDVVKNFILSSAILENNEVVITGVSSATQLRRNPAPVTVIKRADLVKIISTNLFDALSRKPGVTQLSTGPAVSKPFIRGLGYNRILVVNDGVRQEGQQWGDEHGVEIDEYSVNKIEILKGPASLMYGSDALAGVINIITNVPATEGTIKGNIITNYQSNNRLRGAGGNLSGNNNGFNWNIYGSLKAASDYTNKYDGRVYNSKFVEKNTGGYIGYNGRWGFSHLLFSSFNQDLGLIEGSRDNNGAFTRQLPGGVKAPATREDFNYIHPSVPYQRINHFKLATDNSFKTGGGNLAVNIGYQRNKRKEFGNVEAPELYGLYFDLQTVTYNLSYHLKEFNSWRTAAGITGMRQTNYNRGPDVLIPEYNLLDIGGFIFTQKTGDKYSVSGGLRYDTRSLNTDFYSQNNQIKFAALKRKFSNVSGSIGFTYSFSKDVTLKLNAARGFRAPAIPELSSNGAHEGTNRYEHGNNNLKSETSYQLDAGIEANSQHVSFTANLFTNSINNFIFYRKLAASAGGDSLVEDNGGLIPAYLFDQHKAFLAGGEISLDIHPHPFDWLHFENTFSYVRGTFSDAINNSKNLPQIPAARLLSELRAVVAEKGKLLRNITVKLEWEKTFQQQHAFTAFDTETPTGGYGLLNSGFSSDITHKDKILFSVYLGVNNLTDVAYQNHLSRLKYLDENLRTGRKGVFNAGRNFSVKLNMPLSLMHS